MAPQTAFITGCNRGEESELDSWSWCPPPGLGLELVKQLVGLPTPVRHVFATYRSRSRAGGVVTW